MSSGELVDYDIAEKIARRWVMHIAMLPKTEKVAIVGSLRRKKKQVRDIDLQVIGNNYDIQDLFWQKGIELDSGGDRRQIYTLKSGIKMNIFFCYPHAWGTALMHNTGPSRYNIRKRMQVKRQGYKLNQYGVFDNDGSMVDELTTKWDEEKKVYDYFGWTYCMPEDRE